MCPETEIHLVVMGWAPKACWNLLHLSFSSFFFLQFASFYHSSLCATSPLSSCSWLLSLQNSQRELFSPRGCRSVLENRTCQSLLLGAGVLSGQAEQCGLDCVEWQGQRLRGRSSGLWSTVSHCSLEQGLSHSFHKEGKRAYERVVCPPWEHLLTTQCYIFLLKHNT